MVPCSKRPSFVDVMQAIPKYRNDIYIFPILLSFKSNLLSTWLPLAFKTNSSFYTGQFSHKQDSLYTCCWRCPSNGGVASAIMGHMKMLLIVFLWRKAPLGPDASIWTTTNQLNHILLHALLVIWSEKVNTVLPVKSKSWGCRCDVVPPTKVCCCLSTYVSTFSIM